jgi:DNA primase catalytic subunit
MQVLLNIYLYLFLEETFSCREFALNFQGDRYLRNQSYTKICDLKRAIKLFHPVKIDIGAVYNIS